MAVAALFIPSVALWGAGIMKDTLSMAGVGWFTYSLYHLFIVRRRWLFCSIVGLLSLHLVWQTKPYIIIALLPAFAYWVLRHYRLQIKDYRLTLFIFLVTVLLVGTASYFLRDQIRATANDLFVSFVHRAVGFQGWHGLLAAQGASGYNLGEIRFTVGGIFSKFFPSVNVTLFRPYLFEVRNPVMLFSALESAAFLGFTVYVFAKVGFLQAWGIVSRRPFLTFCLLFTLIFGFAVGFTSYNFGALVRYKIPCLPFYLAFLLGLLHEKRLNR